MTISLFTEEELKSKKLTEITDHYNKITKLIGLKEVKKFRDRVTAVSRTLDNQETYLDDLGGAAGIKAEEKASKKESPKVRSNKLGIDYTSIIEAKSEITPKEGTIEATIFDALSLGTEHVENIINHILSNHKRPRSDQKVDEAYALHNIKWFVKKGHLKVAG